MPGFGIIHCYDGHWLLLDLLSFILISCLFEVNVKYRVGHTDLFNSVEWNTTQRKVHETYENGPENIRQYWRWNCRKSHNNYSGNGISCLRDVNIKYYVGCTDLF